MTIKSVLLSLFLGMICISMPAFCVPLKKTISITIDDLPFVGEARNFHLNMMMNAMKEQEVTATGFVIASEVSKNNWETLHQFRDKGFGLGNHTFSHANLNKLKAREYIEEIRKADEILSPILTKPKYFRYPYLAMSSGAKKEKILCYLAKHHYHVAPITIDTKDFVFNQRLLSIPEIDRRAYLVELKPFYLDFIRQQTLRAEARTEYYHQPEQTQILLIHANLLNAYVLPDIINYYKENGYSFVSLKEALKTSKNPIQCASLATKSSKGTKAPKKNSTPIKVASTSDVQENEGMQGYMAWD